VEVEAAFIGRRERRGGTTATAASTTTDRDHVQGSNASPALARSLMRRAINGLNQSPSADVMMVVRSIHESINRYRQGMVEGGRGYRVATTKCTVVRHFDGSSRSARIYTHRYLCTCYLLDTHQKARHFREAKSSTARRSKSSTARRAVARGDRLQARYALRSRCERAW